MTQDEALDAALECWERNDMNSDRTRMRDAIAAYHAAIAGEPQKNNAELMALLVECAEDLAAELDARYPESIRKYPGMGRQYDRDMAPVIKARTLAAAGHTQGSGE